MAANLLKKSLTDLITNGDVKRVEFHLSLLHSKEVHYKQLHSPLGRSQNALKKPERRERKYSLARGVRRTKSESLTDEVFEEMPRSGKTISRPWKSTVRVLWKNASFFQVARFFIMRLCRSWRETIVRSNKRTQEIGNGHPQRKYNALRPTQPFCTKLSKVATVRIF